MHVVITVNTTWNVWNFRRNLVAALLSSGHRVTVFAPRDEYVERLLAMGCQHRHLDMNSAGLNPIGLLRMAWQFQTMLRALRPDVVLSFTVKNNLVNAIVARFFGTPVLPNVTGLGTAFLSGVVLRTVAIHLYRWAFKPLPIIFFQNADDSAEFEQLRITNARQCVLLPGSGVDLQRFTYSPRVEQEAALTFVMIARLLHDKGVVEYAEAARSVKQLHPRTSFVLVGALGVNNRSSISSEQLAQWVDAGLLDYRGEVEDVREVITKSDCVVLPSYREGAPRTLIEASAMGRPVIATRVPGCTAVVDEGKTGLLCGVKDAGSLADSLVQFIAMSPNERFAMGEGGRRKMEAEFDDQLVIRAYERALEKLLLKSNSSNRQVAR